MDISTTPDLKQNCNKRKHSFGASSCERERKFTSQCKAKSGRFKATYGDFPPIKNFSSHKDLTPENTTFKVWSDDAGNEYDKENDLSLKDGMDPRFRSRRRLALSTLVPKGQETKKDKKRENAPKAILTDIGRLEKRQRQIDIGKNTLEYGNYLSAIPRDERGKCHPRTPDKFQLCSTRSWQGQLKVWRRKLHMFDPPELVDECSKEAEILFGIKNVEIDEDMHLLDKCLADLLDAKKFKGSWYSDDEDDDCNNNYDNFTPL